MSPNNCDSCGHDKNMCECPKPETANDRQIGGNHYRLEYQHWDWVTDIRMGYLAGCATKYIVRHKMKTGRLDLEKAEHYVSKMLEVDNKGVKNSSRFMSANMNEHYYAKARTDEFILSADLDHIQATLIRLLFNYESRGDLNVALNILRQYTEALYPAGPFCDQCDTKLVGGVCPRVGCGPMFPGVATQKQAQMLAAAATAAASRLPGVGVVPGRATGVDGMCVDSRGVTGMEDPRGYEGDD